ncbi:MAG: hypothetical protein HEP71_07770 [Roseivirga sp.]|nr:hypothetical protein [Roseivirga sp.]
MNSNIERIHITDIRGISDLTLEHTRIAGKAQIELDLSKVSKGIKPIRFVLKDGHQITRSGPVAIKQLKVSVL